MRIVSNTAMNRVVGTHFERHMMMYFSSILGRSLFRERCFSHRS
jgi:hypothetical protein